MYQLTINAACLAEAQKDKISDWFPCGFSFLANFFQRHQGTETRFKGELQNQPFLFSSEKAV